MAFLSQFQPPSGHCHSTSDSASSRTRGSSASPSRLQTASAFPSCEPHRRVEAVDRLDPGAMTVAGQPAEHRLRGGEAARLAGGDAELDERDEAPVRAAPFAVDVDAEAAVSLLACQERLHLRPLEHARGLRRLRLIEQVTSCLEDDPGLVRVEQPVERRRCDRHVSSSASRSSSSPSRQTPSASSQYSRRIPTRLKPTFS